MVDITLLQAPVDCLKLNFDGAYLSNERWSFVGGIFRNHDGLPFLAYAGQMSASSPIESELQALLHGLIFADKHSIHHLIIEVDCAVIMESMHKEGNLSWDLMHIWEHIKFLTTKYKLWHYHLRRRSTKLLCLIQSCLFILLQLVELIYKANKVKKFHSIWQQ